MLRRHVIILLLALWAGFVAFTVWTEDGPQQAAVALAAQGLLMLLYGHALHFSQASWRGRPIGWGARLLGAALVLIQIVSVSFYLMQNCMLDPLLVLDSTDETMPTLLHYFGQFGLGLIAGGLFIAWAVVCVALSWFIGGIAIPRQGRKNAMLLVGVPLLVAVGWLAMEPWGMLRACTPLVMISERMEAMFQPKQQRSRQHISADVAGVVRRFGPVDSGGAPVFILQLESVNAMAVYGLGKRGLGPEDLMPRLYGAKSQGVFVPFMWGSTIQTHRGQAAILCSAILDRNKGVSYASPAPNGCLPELLKADNYKTVFYSAYPSSQFANTQWFMKQVGFDEMHFADHMKKGDTKFDWGYDDCIFYERSFQALKQRFGNRLNRRMLVFLEVTANHDPFTRKGRYSKAEPFPNPKTKQERYLNSYAAQDFCLAKFFRLVEPYRERAHVFVVPDHSFPADVLDTNGAVLRDKTENFLIPFLYLPPKGKAEQYRHDVEIKEPLLGQVDIVPTILELLSGKPYPNSFASLLKKPENGAEPKLPVNYDDCQVMTQPYGGVRVAVVRGRDKWTYNLTKRKLTHEVIDNRMRETRVPLKSTDKQVSTFDGFLRSYLCERYRYWEPALPGTGRAVALHGAEGVF